MQQVHTIKTGSEFSDSQDLPTVENNQSHLLTATCDTFIKTLDELMDLADTHFNIYGGGPLENGARRVSNFHILKCIVFNEFQLKTTWLELQLLLNY